MKDPKTTPSQKSLQIDVALKTLICVKYPSYELSGTKKENGLLDKQIAGFFGVEPSAFSNYKEAKRKPSKKQVPSMAQSWVKELRKDEAKIPQIQQRLKDAGFKSALVAADGKLEAEIRQFLLATRLPSAMASLQVSTSGLKSEVLVSSLEYGVFSGGSGTFFNRVSDRFFNQVGAEPVSTPQTLGTTESALENGDIHVALSYFAAPNRIKARFYTTPLKVGLGAVTHIRYFDEVGDIADSLHAEQGAGKPIRPIVARHEVGYTYCRHSLHYFENKEPVPGGMVVIDTLTVKDLKAALDGALKVAIETAQQAPSGGNSAPIPVPVVVVDQYTALQLFREMGDNGLFCIPLASEDAIRKSSALRELPVFFMSFAFPRKKEEEEFWNLMRESLDLFLGTEVHTTASALAETFWRLEDEVLDAIGNLRGWSIEQGAWTRSREPLKEHEKRIIAREFALRTFSLDRFSFDKPEVYSNAWLAILKRARDLVLRETVEDKDGRSKLQEAVYFILGGTELDRSKRDGKPKRLENAGQMKLLTRYIDDDSLSIDTCRGRDEAELFSLVKERLTDNEAPKETIEPREVAPDQLDWGSRADPQVVGVHEVLNQLSDMYRKLGDPLILPNAERKKLAAGAPRVGVRVADKIREDLEQKFEAKGRRYLQIVLAMASRPGESPDREKCVGLVLIMETKAGANLARKEKCCEIKYLWVTNKYRQKNIPQLLLGRALDWCKREGYESVRACVLPQLEVAIERFRQIGFKPYDEERIFYDREAPGRLVFRRML